MYSSWHRPMLCMKLRHINYFEMYGRKPANGTWDQVFQWNIICFILIGAKSEISLVPKIGSWKVMDTGISFLFLKKEKTFPAFYYSSSKEKNWTSAKRFRSERLARAISLDISQKDSSRRFVTTLFYSFGGMMLISKRRILFLLQRITSKCARRRTQMSASVSTRRWRLLDRSYYQASKVTVCRVIPRVEVSMQSNIFS